MSQSPHSGQASCTQITYGVGAKFPAGMLGLAVGALVKAAGVDGYDLYEWISSHFWQQEGGTTSLLPCFFLLAQQPYRIA